jgi:glycyl-tRNA synthetase beta chain
LVGAFAIGQKPTGVKDPFKLRRHALAVVRILIAHPTPVGLSHLIQLALDAYGDELNASPEVCSELHGFILDRIPAFYQAQGITPDCVQAVFARQSDWLFDLDKRVRDLLAFSHLPEAVVLSAACKRVNNLLQQASVTEQAVDETLLHEKAEQVLFDEMNRIEKQIATPVVASDYGYILTQLASIRDPLNVFFEQVMVMSQDLAIRDNRLRLLARLQTLLQGVADISLLQITS